MRRIALLAAAMFLFSHAAFAQTLVISDFGTLGKIAVEIDGRGNMKLIGFYQNVVINTVPTPTPVPADEPTGPGQLICIRPWSCTLDESDADLTIRESIDAAGSKVPYLRFLPGQADQRLQLHSVVERYRKLSPDQSKGWVFHVAPTRTTPRIVRQGPLDADAVLGWIGVPKVAFAAAGPANEAQWLDVDFAQQPAERLGAIELPPELNRQAIAAAANVRTLPGFKPIPKSEWSAWVARFPMARLAKSVRNITEQTMGSCVGHACGNGVETGCYMMGGDWLFRRISGMSMYKRIGRSPNSGAYIPDAADEIFGRGILPVTGETYPHTFSQDTGWSTALPSGWEATGAMWKAVVYSVDDEEAGFRIGVDCRLNRQIGRSSHSINAGGYTGRSWWYENSWGVRWGDFGKSIGYDSRFYSGYVYQPVLRDEIQILEARELPAVLRQSKSTAMQDSAKAFHDRIEEIKRQAELLQATPKKE